MSITAELKDFIAEHRDHVMDRRGFLLTSLAGALAAPLAAEAQQAGKVYRVGFITPLSGSPEPPTLRAFRQELRALDYVEGSNVLIETRFAEGRPERLPELIAELLRLRLDVLLVGSTPGAVAAKKATAPIPIVFAGVSDPIGPGIVTSLSHPGGNITGVTVGIDSHIAGKWVELLRDAIPSVSHVAALSHAAYPLSVAQGQAMQAAASAMNIKLDVLEAGNAEDLDRALGAIAASGAGGIIVTAAPFLTDSRARIAQFAIRKHLPAVPFSKLFAEAGGLMSYGGSLEDSYRRAATYVDKVLKGAKPADLPVERADKFDLVINLKTAKVLGLTIPPSLLLRDQVIK